MNDDTTAIVELAKGNIESIGRVFASEVERLCKSGGVGPSILTSTVFAVALQNMSDNQKGKDKEQIQDFNNLSKF